MNRFTMCMVVMRPFFLSSTSMRGETAAERAAVQFVSKSDPPSPHPPRFIPPVCQTKRQTWSVRRCLGCVIAGVNSRSLRALILPVPTAKQLKPVAAAAQHFVTVRAGRNLASVPSDLARRGERGRASDRAIHNRVVVVFRV